MGQSPLSAHPSRQQRSTATRTAQPHPAPRNRAGKRTEEPASVDTPREVLVWKTPLGWLAIVTTPDGLARLVFGGQSAAELQRRLTGLGLTPQPDATVTRLAKQIRQAVDHYLETGRESFAEIPIDWGQVTPFRRRVLEATRQIPAGETLTYQQLAERVGSPRGARPVGGAMASNRCPIVVPCHRVIGSTSSSGGYTSPGGMSTKNWLLQLEQQAVAAAAHR